MRFLCLHGSGTTGDILSIQLASFRQKLGEKNHTFDFWDGPYTSKAGPGVGPFFDPPYYCWWKTPSEAEVRSAAERLLKLLRERKDQPYDIVIGFSQGVALLSAVILLCQNEYSGEPLPFKGAVSFCGGVPGLFLENFMSVSQEAKDTVNKMNEQLHESSVVNGKKIEAMIKSGKRVELWDQATLIWDGKETIMRDPWMLPELDEKDVFGLDVSNLPKAAVIDIPMVVVYGHKDPMSPFHVQLAYLCKREKRLVYDHRGGHEIPRTPKVISDLASAFNWLQGKIQEEK